MDILKTATGKAFDCDFLVSIPAPERLYIRVKNSDVDTLSQIFGDANETASLVYAGDTIVDFTKLVGIIPETNEIQIVLEKE